MHAFNIKNLQAECTFGYQVILNLPESKIINRGILVNLSVYSPNDDEFPENKIMNFVDGEMREGFLNFYLMRFSNNACYIFSFGINNGINFSDSAYVGDFQGYKDVTTKLTSRLNKEIEDSKEEFKILYATKNVNGIKKLVTKIIH